MFRRGNILHKVGRSTGNSYFYLALSDYVEGSNQINGINLITGATGNYSYNPRTCRKTSFVHWISYMAQNDNLLDQIDNVRELETVFDGGIAKGDMVVPRGINYGRISISDIWFISSIDVEDGVGSISAVHRETRRNRIYPLVDFRTLFSRPCRSFLVKHFLEFYNI